MQTTAAYVACCTSHVSAHVSARDDFDILNSSNYVDHVMSDQHERRRQILDSIRNWSPCIEQFRQVEFLIVEVWKMVLVFIQMCWRPLKRLKGLTLRFSSELVKGYTDFKLKLKIYLTFMEHYVFHILLSSWTSYRITIEWRTGWKVYICWPFRLTFAIVQAGFSRDVGIGRKQAYDRSKIRLF